MDNLKLVDIVLPVGVSIRVDDVGWLRGHDERMLNRPARSGLPRLHTTDDYRVLHEIGKGLGVKVLCNLVLGDWDIKNRLRGVPHLTWDEKGWDCASVIEKNRAYFEESFDILEGSEYLEYGLHGLQHAYYENDVFKDAKFLYPFQMKDEKGRSIRGPLPAEEFKILVDLFYEIYNDWGFKKDIRVFQSGCGCFGTPYDDYNREFSRILRERGIGIWQWGGWPRETIVNDGTIYVNTVSGDPFLNWNEYSVDPSILHDCFVQNGKLLFSSNICGHLANFVQVQPEKNFDYTKAWIDYFRRVCSHFGAVLARDNEESASQAVYSTHAKIDVIDGGYHIDLAPVDAIRTPLVEDHFYVSLREKALPREVIGGKAYVKDCRSDHVVYGIERDKNATSVDILF